MSPPESPEPGFPSRRNYLAIGLGALALALAAALVVVVLSTGSDDEGSSAADEPADAGQQISFDEAPETEPAAGGDDSGGIAASVPEGSVAVVEGYVNGEIKRDALERRASLVTLRDEETTGAGARSQALDELIFNRWVRANAEESGVPITAEQIAAEIASPEFAPEAERLRSIGYEEDGVQLDAEARLAAEQLFGEGAPELAILTEGYDGGSGGAELDRIVSEYRPQTACSAEVAALSPFCANGPEP